MLMNPSTAAVLKIDGTSTPAADKVTASNVAVAASNLVSSHSSVLLRMNQPTASTLPQASSSFAALIHHAPVWRFNLDVYLDPCLNLSLIALECMCRSLLQTYPLSRIKASVLSMHAHATMMQVSYDRSRQQVNGSALLDLIDDQHLSSRPIVPITSPFVPINRTQAALPPPNTVAHTASFVTASSILKPDAAVAAKVSDKPFHPQVRSILTDSIKQRATFAISSDRVRADDVAPALLNEKTSIAVKSKAQSDEDASSRPKKRARAEDAEIRVHEAQTKNDDILIPINEIRVRNNVSVSDACVTLSLILTPYDAFVSGMSFVFGVARLAQSALVSTSRLKLENEQSSALFMQKEAIHEVGHQFGLEHCNLLAADKKPCVMTFSSTVKQALCKSNDLCSSCRDKVNAMRFGYLSTKG